MASFLDTLFGGGAQQQAAGQNSLALMNYGDTAIPALAQGYNTGVANLTNAGQAFAPLSTLGTKYSSAGDLLLGAEGAGGPAGTAAAKAAFTNAPGYAGGVTAGTDAINRQLAASGMSQSGNAAEDVGTFTQNLQNQQYNTWLQNLQQTAGMGLNATASAASGEAGADTGLASLGYQYGGDQGNIAGNIASGTIGDNNMVAQGEAQGAQNLLGAGLSLATLGLGGGLGKTTGGTAAPFSLANTPLGQIGSSIMSGAKSLFS